MIVQEFKDGSVTYTDNTLANIVGLEVTEVPGVVGMAAKNAADGILSGLQKDNYAKGITVLEEDGQLIISVGVIVSRGTKSNEVAKNIITKVKYAVENLTGINVKRVAVTISGIRTKE